MYDSMTSKDGELKINISPTGRVWVDPNEVVKTKSFKDQLEAVKRLSKEKQAKLTMIAPAITGIRGPRPFQVDVKGRTLERDDSRSSQGKLFGMSFKKQQEGYVMIDKILEELAHKLTEASRQMYLESGAALTQSLITVQGNTSAWDILTESFIDKFIEGYEMIDEDESGRDLYYWPSKKERALIKDAIMGLLAKAEEEAKEQEKKDYVNR